MKGRSASNYPAATNSTVARAVRAAGFAGIGAMPGSALIVAAGPITGELELLVGVAGIALAGIGLAMGAAWGWLGRPPASVWLVITAPVLVTLFIVGGMLGRVLALVALVVLIGTRMGRR